MDYLEYDSFSQSPTKPSSSSSTAEPVQPAPPLILPLNTVTNKFKNLSILSTLNYKASSQDSPLKEKPEDVIDSTQQAAKKYSQLTLDLFEANELGFDSNTSNTTGNSNTVDLSNRLAKILNSYGYDTDSTLRDSFEFLQSTNNTNSDGKGKVSPAVVSDQFSFRNAVEMELLKTNSADLKVFSGVVSDLEDVRVILDKLNSFEFIKADTSKDSEDNQLKTQIEELQKKKDLIQLKRSLLLNFKSKFMISEYDESLTYSTDVTLETFITFNKIYKTYQNSEVLMGLENSQIGANVMSKLSSTLSKFYQRFQSYLSRSIKASSTTSSHLSLNLKLIKLCNLYLTSNIDQYSDNFIADFKATRCGELQHDFKAQLIQLNIFIIDSNRYFGDVLAYIHSLIVNEVEYVRGLFEINLREFNGEEQKVIEEFKKTAGIVKTEGDKNNDNDNDNDHDLLIIDILNSLNSLLEPKLTMVLNSESNLQNLTMIYQSLDFYVMIFHKLKLPSLSIFPLIIKLQNLIISKLKSLIFSQLQSTTRSLEETAWKLDDDLLLPQDWLSSYLTEILPLFDSTPSDSPIFSNSFFITAINDLIVTKPIELVQKQAKVNFPKTKPINVNEVREMNIFILNNLDYLKYKTLQYPQLTKSSSEEKEVKDQNAIEELLTKIIANELDLTLDWLTLKTPNQLVTLVYPPSQIQYDEDYEMYRSLLEHKIFSLENLQTINTTLVEKLPELSLELNDKFSKIQSPTYVDRILREVGEGIVEFYQVFYRIVWMLYEENEDEEDEQKSVVVKEESKERVLSWSADEVKALVGL